MISSGDVAKNIWQIGSGTAGKDYANDFLKYGVALIGSGDPGPWPGNYKKDKSTRHIRQFAEEAKVGDIIILRQGKTSIRAVGFIASDYQYLAQFDDVDGWDLQHARRVRWFPFSESYDFGKSVFGAIPGRFSAVGVQEVVNFIMRFIQSQSQDWQRSSLPDLSVKEPYLDPPPPNIAHLVAMAKDYYARYFNQQDFGELPSEDEMVAHFIIPLLRAMGWPPELIAIKWHDIDIILFNKLPRNPENCHIIIEAKRYDTGFEHALAQAKGYLRNLAIERDILITDGIRYSLYFHERSFELLAYANLSRLKSSAINLFDNIKR